MDSRGLWQAVLGELEVSVSRASFSTWFKHTSIISQQDGHVVVAVPNIFTKEWLEKKYDNDIKATMQRMNAPARSIEYKVSATPTVKDPMIAGSVPAAPAQESHAAPTPVAAAPATSSPSLNSRYTFDSFVVGSSNELAYAACQAVVKSPGSKYNPLFIYGGVGLGKTHLMQAIGNELLRHDPSKRIGYVTSEEFTSEFIASVSSKKTKHFADKYRSLDVLIVDDIQFLGNKEKTQEEFFHTFNTLYQRGKQIVMSSDKPPKAIPHLEERLRSRFESGMAADIQTPDLETRAAILKRRAASQGAEVPDEVIEHIARQFQHNIRELEGALTQFLAFCELRGMSPSIAAASSLLGSLAVTKARRRSATPRSIIEQTASYFDLRSEDITGPRRDRDIVVPRQIAMYLMRHELGLSFPKIASCVGGRDHTTAMHSVSKVEKLLEVDESLREELNQVRDRITA